MYSRLIVAGFLLFEAASMPFCHATPPICQAVGHELSASDSLTTDSTEGKTLHEVTVKATRFLFVTKKDTTIYDLDALNLKSGAQLREAFEKLPGMSFRNGTLYHNGREVRRVLINGMDFSSKDPMLALQALPAYIMKDVKVYERKSDFAMRYGVDDGREQLVADVSVRRKYMGTWTGELVAGGGTGGRFVGKAFGNTFTDRFRVSLFGNANNINEQMWYNGDGKERAGEAQAGDNRFYTPGGTFFWKNGKGMRDKGYLYIEGGLDYNKEIYDKEERQSSELYLSDGSMFSASDTRHETNTDRLAGHLNADWNVSKALTLNYRGAFDVHNTKDNSSVLKANWNENPLPHGGNISDTLEHLLTDDGLHPNAIDLQQKKNGLDGDGFGYSHDLALLYKIANTDTYFKLGHNMSIGQDDREEHDDTYYKYFNTEAPNFRSIDRLLTKSADSHGQGATARVMQYLDVKGFRRFCLFVEYTYKWKRHLADEAGYLDGQAEADGSRNYLIDDETTRNWWDRSRHHSVMTGLSFGKGVFNMDLHPCFNFRNDEINYAKRNLAPFSLRKEYRYVSLQSVFRVRSEKFGNLLWQYFITPNIPDIHSFVTYPDMADPQYVTLGNTSLEMGQNHSLAAWYWRDFTRESEKGKVTRSLSAHIFFKHMGTTVADYTTYDRTTGVITVKPVNVYGNWNGEADVTFTTPFDVAQRFWFEAFVKATVLRTQSFSGVADADNTQQQFNDNRLYTYSVSLKPRLKLAPVDLSVAYELTAEDNSSTYASANGNTQWQHHLQGKLNLTMPWKLNFDATLNYHNYAGYLSGKRENWVMLDLGIERAFLKNENLFVSVSGHDLFNQNDGFLRQYSATALTHTYRKTLGRYGMLTMKYRFASKKK